MHPLDEETVSLLMSLGLARASARALACLATAGEVVSADVERASDLRQPEVSTAMHDLRARGWVEARDVRTGAKGRPQRAYRLARPFEAVLAEMEEARRRAAERDLMAIARLRAKTLQDGTSLVRPSA